MRASRLHSSDKTIITRWIGDDKKVDRNESHKYSKRQDCRTYLHQKQKNDSYRAAIAASKQKQSSDCVNPTTLESNAQQRTDIDADADADADIVKINGDDGSDIDFEEMECVNKQKVNIVRYLLTFNEEDIHLTDLPPIELNKIIEAGQSFRLFLSQLHSPFKFWFHLNADLEKIDSIMSRLKYVRHFLFVMQSFHLNLRTIYCLYFSDFYYQNQSMLAQTPIPDEFLKIGMTCAAIYNSEWHRAKIVEILDNTVKVNK